MASYTILREKNGEYKLDKKGRMTYIFKFNRGEKTPLQERWKPDPSWSPRTLDSRLNRALADFETRCERGEVQSRAEKKAAQEAAEAARVAAEEEDKKKLTLKTYIEDVWLPSKRLTCSEGTIRLYERVCRLHIVKALGSYRIAEIKAGQIKELMIGLLAAKSDVKNTYRILNGIFGEAERDELTPGNVMRRVKCPKPSKDTVEKKKVSLTVEEVADLLEIADTESPVLRALVYLLADTGARIGEILALQWSAIDWENSTIRINGTRDVMTNEIRAPKTEDSCRTLTVGPEALRTLQEWRVVQASRGHGSADVFTSRLGNPLSYTSVTKSFHRLGKKIGIETLHPHMLRHSAATIAIESGADISGVSRRLGHSNVNTTLGIYTNSTDKAAEAAGCAARNAIRRAKEAKNNSQHLKE